MNNKITLDINSIELLKYALFRDYNLPSELAFINLTQERILMTIKNSFHLSMVSISRGVGLEKGPFSQTVDKLEALGLVQRIRSKTDKRLIHLELTAEGLTLTQKVEASMLQHFDQVLKNLNNKDADALVDALGTINKIANQLISK